MVGGSLRSVVANPEIAELVPYGEEQVAQLYVADWPYMLEHRPEFTERWNKEVLEQ